MTKTEGGKDGERLGKRSPTQMVKKVPAMQETWFQSLAKEDPLKKEGATHSSILG